MCYKDIFSGLNQNIINKIKKEIYRKCKCKGPNFTGKTICKLKIANSEKTFYSLSKLLEVLQKFQNLNVSIQIICKCEQKEPEIEPPAPKQNKHKEKYQSIDLGF